MFSPAATIYKISASDAIFIEKGKAREDLRSNQRIVCTRNEDF